MIRAVFDTSFWSADIRECELRMSAGLGPVGYRVRNVVVSILLMMAAAGTLLLLSALVSLYPGTGTVVRGPGDRAVQATGGACARVGPVSGYGFGYSWDCNAILRDGDGENAHGPGGSLRPDP
ncbi:DUF6346 domain-containing protein [Micromonospora sp. WMMD956]|uniref:DUF6346 domain-containing protein n=1 Tax=Micromonospora sp. WMMD956 TaxID=3016108 RepID=UPI00241788A9|nr:DUF6346 domain-containing protein [Micromonospora sp. WMMD956]MDG4818474.1 DUF6346 domain-containing protein [Micromonospora sp. WMMD956]